MWLLLACTASDPVESTPTPFVDVPWSKIRPAFTEQAPTGERWQRGIIHLHSHYSHDACDGEPMPGGVPDEACLGDLRQGLCETAMDYAFITDHPSHAAYQSFEDLLLVRDGDQVIDGVANSMACPDGHRVLLMPGIEDELMPVGLTRQVSEDPEEADQIYNSSDAATIAAETATGALVLQAHTESRTIAQLKQRQAAGLRGVEIFNLHAMLDPDIRKDYLGLEPLGYLQDLGPFLATDSDITPDLGFLAIFQEQATSLQSYDALAAVGPITAHAGTDAHQNVLPPPLSDGERFDSYRRMISLFSNLLMVQGEGPSAVKEALGSGRNYVVFEVLGTPTGLSVSYEGQEAGGGGATGGTLKVVCPTLSPFSPQLDQPPEISAIVFKDGQVFQEECGEFVLTEPGVYRVRFDILPLHLATFLGSEADDLVHVYPWIYSNGFRVGL